MVKLRLPRWLHGKESGCQCSRRRFNPMVRKILWRRKWQPMPVFLPGKSHGQRSLAGYCPWHRRRVRHDLVTKTRTKVKQMPQSSHKPTPFSLSTVSSLFSPASLFFSLSSPQPGEERLGKEGAKQVSSPFTTSRTIKSSHNNTHSNEETRPEKTSNLHAGCFKPQHWSELIERWGWQSHTPMRVRTFESIS